LTDQCDAEIGGDSFQEATAIALPAFPMLFAKVFYPGLCHIDLPKQQFKRGAQPSRISPALCDESAAAQSKLLAQTDTRSIRAKRRINQAPYRAVPENPSAALPKASPSRRESAAGAPDSA
jgi:hypothetical protein